MSDDDDRRKRIKTEEDNKVKGTLVLTNNHSFLTTIDELLGRKLVSLQLISAESTAAKGFRGKLGKETPLTKGDSTFELEFDWDDEDGVPGAFLIINRHRKEFYLKTLTLTHVPNVGRLHFVCNSWIYNEEHYTKGYRVFFSNQTYLPGKTPKGICYYREEELVELRGDGTGKREEWDRVYDYDVYNDLSQPDKGSELVRPILGGSTDRPYPRRCRTGRSVITDSNMESRIGILQSLQIYVPRDERFSDLKMQDVYAYGLKLVSQGLLPGFESVLDKISDEIVGAIENAVHHKFKSVSSNKFNEFSSFDDVLNLYHGGLEVPKFNFLESVKEKMPEFFRELFRSDGEHLAKFPVPQVIKVDRSAWRTDEEFGRELLAGICPVVIRRLQEFPPTSELDPTEFGNQNSTITEDHIKDQMDGLSVWEAMRSNRLFILDHHDPLMPYLRGINETPTKTYATRTILFLYKNGTLKPIAIELSLPHPDGDEAGAISTVHTPASDGIEGTIWLLLAKAYANVNDSGYHQLVCHWLHTHATIEPFIIATHRQLSVLHPIHKLLHPHFRDTMNINALSRQTLISAGGLLEKTVFPDKYSLPMSCNMYKKWDFTKQALPADLIDRGMAVPDSTLPHGVRLIIEDYPFAVDGLEIWSAIKSWVHEYVCIYYKTNEDIQNDTELKNWWHEVRTKGHGDLQNKSWWPKMWTRDELIQSCTIIIWVASALHAAVNFGQYPYGGYLPNRPAMSRRLLPEPGTTEYDELETDQEKAFLKTVTPQLQSILGISLIEVLSRHSKDELYLGERDTPEWTADKDALEAFERFGANLRRIERKIDEMNRDERLINRTGPAQMPYTLLYPSSEVGLTGRGIPNSVSI
ncbi:putative linoleate 9S-lipoxygenase 5 [Bidens hawaiensis]|uniref:putative linoleate 9S-lipoxygenase 5 n=1 Tax=Bidens hawaiensis TaxID=980011 RepID=UPI00404914DE